MTSYIFIFFCICVNAVLKWPFALVFCFNKKNQILYFTATLLSVRIIIFEIILANSFLSNSINGKGNFYAGPTKSTVLLSPRRSSLNYFSRSKKNQQLTFRNFKITRSMTCNFQLQNFFKIHQIAQ